MLHILGMHQTTVLKQLAMHEICMEVLSSFGLVCVCSKVKQGNHLCSQTESCQKICHAQVDNERSQQWQSVSAAKSEAPITKLL